MVAFCACLRCFDWLPDHRPSLFDQVPCVVRRALYHGPDRLVVVVVHSEFGRRAVSITRRPFLLVCAEMYFWCRLGIWKGILGS
jgi:hypothetical protein